MGVVSGSLYRRTHSLIRLAWFWVGGRLAPFYIHQMNRVNSAMAPPWCIDVPNLVQIFLSTPCILAFYEIQDGHRLPSTVAWLCWKRSWDHPGTHTQSWWVPDLLSENKCRLLFRSLVESLGNLTKDDIADDFAWPFKVISGYTVLYEVN